MQKTLQLSLLPDEAATPELLKEAVAPMISVDPGAILHLRIDRKSIDARSRQVRINLTVTVFVDELPKGHEITSFAYNPLPSGAPEVVIVGAGPAGLFAALRCIELGIKPLLLERGKEVAERKKDIAQLCRNQGLNPESNYCFGEGGAGTFSDGKLYTRSRKRGDARRIFDNFYFHGAPESILYESHPHIGTDKLPDVIRKMRKTLLDCGGEVWFQTKVTGLCMENGRVVGVTTAQGSSFRAKAVILATGHSARDVYENLYNEGVLLEAKPFAMGLRVEHPQAFIDSVQYHSEERGPSLPAASYSLVDQVDGRGVYSFCMCPGGYIVPAATEQGGQVVNGMSSSRRHTPFANSGILAEIRLEDIPGRSDHPLAGLQYQHELERLAFINGGGGQIAPAQRLDDFVKGRLSSSLPDCSYLPGVISSPVHFWLPELLSQRLRRGFQLFDNKIRGFVSSEAIVVGVESRSSSPVRIPRDAQTLQHVALPGLFPCGEGSGYAGGITSSAMDGEQVAEQVALQLKTLCN